MKKILTLAVVIVMALGVAIPAQAQIKFGPRIGMTVNKLHFNQDVFQSDNRTGFTGGLELEAMIPAVGIGLDLSVMYVRRNGQFMSELDKGNSVTNYHADYFDIPIYLKWKFGLPIVGSIIKPFLFTGPDFAFLTSRKAINEAWKQKKVDTSWNVGLGVELFKHLQVAASYGIGMSKAASATGLVHQGSDIEGKNRYWTVTAAYLF